MVSCPLAAAAVLSCRVQADRWVAPHLAVRTLLDCVRWSCRVTQPVQRTPFASAAVTTFRVEPDRWIAPHLAVSAYFDGGRWACEVAQLVQCSPLWPASWLPAVDKSRGSKSFEVQRVWEVGCHAWRAQGAEGSR